MARLDPHSYHDTLQPQATQLSWKARIDFDRRLLHAEAQLTFSQPAVADGPLDLDTRDLDIEEVIHLETRQALPFVLSPPEPVLGRRLSIAVPRGCPGVGVRYRTSPTASALMWLLPAQTQGGTLPFLFSQCQAIHARSILPLQDTPRVRIRYRAELTLPRPLRALMAAEFVERTEKKELATEVFSMPQPIPPYLFAFAVGALASRELSPRSRVWAEPPLLDAAAWEFSEVEKMMRTAEGLFGPYDWDRFDLLLMPPSFPYGGMENPRLTFLTPTLLAKDRSLVNVLAHELAHSWTGNLVTNAHAEHFWLNEGFTVFAELRILEALEGEEKAQLHQAVLEKSLEEAFRRFSGKPELTRLKTSLSGVDPDDAFSEIPYVKGCLFLQALEAQVGRRRFDAFLKDYLKTFRFQSIATEDFIDFTEHKLPGALEKVQAPQWLYQPGLPEDAPRSRSRLQEDVLSLGAALPETAQGEAWSALEWQLYLDAYPRPLSAEACETLDNTFGLSNKNNAEVLCSWLQLALTVPSPRALARTEEFLGQVGRMKYLRPLYTALLKSPETRPLAQDCFRKYQARYHPIARQMVEGVFQALGPVRSP